MSNDKDWTSVLIPMIRKLAPAVLAQEIVGVQPMNIDLPPRVLPKYQEPKEYNEQVPNGYLVVDVNREVSLWIEEQPIRFWKHGELKALPSGFYDRYIISQELFTWLKMRF